MLFCLMAFSMRKTGHVCKQQITGPLIILPLSLDGVTKKNKTKQNTAQILWNRLLAIIFYFGLIAIPEYRLRLSLSVWNMKHKICLEELSFIT